MTYMVLMPREIELLERPVLGQGEHADLMRLIQGRIKGEDLELTDAELVRVRAARRNFRLGYERQFQAVLDAAERHP